MIFIDQIKINIIWASVNITWQGEDNAGQHTGKKSIIILLLNLAQNTGVYSHD